MPSPLFSPPVRLCDKHKELLRNFHCGERTLDLWLRINALPNEARGGSRTYVVLSTDTGQLAGFFCLSTHSVERADFRAKFKRGMPNPVPAILLGRLAVALQYQRHGLGESMLQEAVFMAKCIATTLGAAALITHPISEKAASFYKKHGFSSAKSDKPMMFIDLHDPILDNAIQIDNCIR